MANANTRCVRAAGQALFGVAASTIGCVVGVFGLAGHAGAQSIAVTVSPPVVDRWMYPFGSEPGSRAVVPVFSSTNACGPDARFDDRDSQMLITFATSASVETGWPEGAYRLRSVRLTVRTSDVTPYFYDATADTLGTFLAPGDGTPSCPADPQFIADGDAGRPLELFGVAFRNGFSALTYGEVSPFKPGSAFTPPWHLTRNAFPVAFDDAGAQLDASDPVKNRDLRVPLALGAAPAVASGAMPPDGTEYRFELTTDRPGERQYVQRSLSQGRLALMITALYSAEQQVVGSYPNIYTKEADPLFFPNAAPPALTLDVFLCKADVNGDGGLDPDDLSDYITSYFSTPGAAGNDFNRDGSVDPDDLSDVITAFFAGCE